MGRNLLCIYSKRYIDTPPEEKARKTLHNRKTMERMSELLSEGGKCIYVAPSGGRDRRNAHGVVEVAPFDPQSVEMFLLMAERAPRITHFYPMALATYDFLPPPETIQVQLGEARQARRLGLHLAVGGEIDMVTFPGSDAPDKRMRREARASYIWRQVADDYARFPRD
jgi:glycerol-3-phosphate O-acyltransferase